MKKPTRLEASYYALERLESGPIDAEAMGVLDNMLREGASLLVSKAADIAGVRGIQELIPSLVSAFDRFIIAGARGDKQCSAKTSIANALNTLEYMGDDVFLAGARYIQMEPSFGKPVDTAVELRGSCAFGLARTGHPEAHYVLADLLADPEIPVRVAAAKALGYLGTPEGEVLLRLRTLTGEAESEVIGECFTSLLTMAPNNSMNFVARFLRSEDPTILQCAAIAIGASRIPQAFETLRERRDADFSPTIRAALLLPIALVRSPEAVDFLLDIVRSAESKMAAEALSALSLYVDDETVERIRHAVVARGDSEMLKRFDSEFRATG